MEDLGQRLWPTFTWVALTLAVFLSDLLPRLPGWLHVGLLTGLVSIITATLIVDLWGWRPPTLAMARKRLELPDRSEPGTRQASPADRHRPWTAATDSLALGNDDPLTQALWTRHQAIMAAKARTLHARPPQPRLAREDPQAVRILALILLVVAVIIAWPDPWSRLERAITPRLGPAPAPVQAQVWITPPGYTGQAPLYLQARPDDPLQKTPAKTSIDAGQTRPIDALSGAFPGGGGSSLAGLSPISDQPLTIPAGSTVLVLLRGGRGTSHLDLGPNAIAYHPSPAVSGQPPGQTDTASEAPTDTTPDDGLRLTLVVETASRLMLTQDGRTLIDRPLTVQPDQPPAIRFTAPPDADPHGTVTLRYQATDDHGVTAVQALVRPAGGQRLGDPVTLDLPPPSAPSIPSHSPELGTQTPAPAQLEAHPDLRAHPWAGTPVTITLQARDGRGHVARSDPMTLMLPERRFTHPVAQAVADLRRALVLAPERARAVGGALRVLAEDTDAYNDRLAVFLTLKAAAARLMLAPGGVARADDLAPLWSLALALEDGSLSLTRQALEDAREALRHAIEKGAPADEIARRLQDVREAMTRLLDSLAENLPLSQMTMTAPMTDTGATLRPDDISRMLNDLATLTELGAEDAARALLDQLDQVLDQLQGARPPTQAELRAMADMADMARRLRDVAEQQEDLLAKTFAQDPMAADGADDPALPEPLAELLRSVPSLSLRPMPFFQNDEDSAPGPDGSSRIPSAEEVQRWLEQSLAEDRSPEGRAEDRAEHSTGAEDSTENGPDDRADDGGGSRGVEPPDRFAPLALPPSTATGGTEDRSFPPNDITRDLEARQRAVRQALEALMADLGDRLGQVPPALSDAGLAMREAEDALANGDIGAATHAQGRALEALRQGSQQAMTGMAGQAGIRALGLGGLPGLGAGSGQGSGPGWGRGWGQGRDPLNRPSGNGMDEDSVHLPTEPEARRARDILQELRRRANDAHRPAEERHYLDRLIEPF